MSTAAAAIEAPLGAVLADEGLQADGERVVLVADHERRGVGDLGPGGDEGVEAR